MTARPSAFDLDVGGVRIACDRYGAENAPPGGPSSHVPQRRIAEAAKILPDARLPEIPVGHRIHGERPTEFPAAVANFVTAT